MVFNHIQSIALWIAILAVGSVLAKNISAAIPPEDPQILIDQFSAKIDTRAQMRFERILTDVDCPPEGSETYVACTCYAIYAITKIAEKPQTLDLKENDQLWVSHPCHAAGFKTR